MENKAIIKKSKWTIELSEEQMEQLLGYYEECDVRDAEDNLYRAIWGCGCCVIDGTDNLKNGITDTITNAVKQILDAHKSGS